MRTLETPRGFRTIVHARYSEGPPDEERLIQESSAIGDYEDSLSNPGSSALWVGEYHHLDREGVQRLVVAMQHWLEHKRLPVVQDLTAARGRGQSRAREIRLACADCDRDDHDGIDRIPADWIDVADPTGRCPSDWWTHLGTCPECAAQQEEESTREVTP